MLAKFVGRCNRLFVIVVVGVGGVVAAVALGGAGGVMCVFALGKGMRMMMTMYSYGMNKLYAHNSLHFPLSLLRCSTRIEACKLQHLV
jgi:hypothetical protein